MTEDNQAFIGRMADALFNVHELDRIEEFYSPDCVRHDAFEGDSVGIEAVKAELSELLAAFPDLRIVIDDLIAVGDRVVSRFTLSCTHQGEYQSIPPTGQQFEVAGIVIYRIDGGRIVEEWSISDKPNMFMQLLMTSALAQQRSITVVKIGGSTLGQHDTSLDDIAALHKEGHQIVVVHGGGATITGWLDKLGAESRFVDGLRVTDEKALDIVVAVLAGLVNTHLVAELEARGVPAYGLSGADGAILRARRYDPALGLVGELSRPNAEDLHAAVGHTGIAVLAPVAVEEEAGSLRSQLLNVNADTVAGEVAACLAAERLVFLTDVPGVMDASGSVLAVLTKAEAASLVANGVVVGGMVPKVNAALRAASFGVSTSIVDGREAGALRGALSEAGPGTRIS